MVETRAKTGADILKDIMLPGSEMRQEDGIYFNIPKDQAYNPLEKVNYDAIHSIDIKPGDVLAKRYLQLAGMQNRTDLRILEIGCGTGRLTTGLAGDHRVGMVIASDISLNFLLANRAKVEKHVPGGLERTVYLCADVNDLPFRDGEFDIVVGNSILHHIYDYETMLKGFSKRLKSGGKAIFNEPCQEGKSLMAFFLALIVQEEERSAKPYFSRGELQLVRNSIAVMMREKTTKDHPELKLKMEDKHIFRTEHLARRAGALGYSGFASCNTTRLDGRIQEIAEATIRLVGLQKSLAPFSHIFQAYQDTVVDLLGEDVKSPHQFLIYTK